MRDLACIFSDFDDACHRLAIGLGGPAYGGAASGAALDMALLFEELTELVREQQRPEGERGC